jgi:YYY domain-containing protein
MTNRASFKVRETIIKLTPYVLFVCVFAVWAIILKSEFQYVLVWWAALLFIGLMYYPLSNVFFSSFTDRGFLLSKTIGLAVSSYILWLMSFIKVLPVSRLACFGAAAVPGILLYIHALSSRQRMKALLPDYDALQWIFTGESLFLFALCFWTYLRGFNPRIEGLEKFMDYGFLNSVLRSEYVPPKDMWFAGGNINYYYFGHYISAFITRLSGIKTEIAYNIMMAALFAFCMALSFVIAANLLKGFGIKKKAQIIGGIISAFLVSLGGNLHSFFYGFLSKFTEEGDKYWFPDATRYIGYNPETRDKTIHEFPVYSFVVSDLHAHVINMVFVLSLLALLIAVFRKLQKRRPDNFDRLNIISEAFIPELLLLGLLTGIFQMSNYWDYPIYLTVTLFTLFCAGIRQYGYNKTMINISFIRFFIVLASSIVFALPFNMAFDNMAGGIRFTEDRTLPHQFFVLWGYQLTLTIIFFIYILYTEQNIKLKREYSKKRQKIRSEMTLIARIQNVLDKNPIEDVFAVILCVSAIGLLIIPEIVYVKDIYSAEHKRANTMFKLTYQAFIMFGLAAGYIFIRIRRQSHRNWRITAAKIIAIIMIALPMIYPFYAIPSWYRHLDPERYEGLDGLAFMKKEHPDDYDLVIWLRENVQGQPAILEANGDSYSYYGRISMSTGLPTIQGWYVHEWLWRNDFNIVNERVEEVKTVYESVDIDMTRKILGKYQIKYIVIGQPERDSFPELNEEKLLALGNVVFERPEVKLIEIE